MSRIVERTFSEGGEESIETDLDPSSILHDPLLNKGTGFTEEERRDLGIQGMLPYHVSTIEEQVERRYTNFQSKKTDLERYVFLSALQDRNEILFFRLISEHPEEMLPYIYTPTIGDASLNYSYLYNQNRGLYLSYPMRDRMEEMIAKIPQERVDIAVVTDGGRILGLGDLGVGGMAIPLGKLSLYVAFGGLHPSRALPVFLDVGTNNRSLLADPLYLGWQHERVTGREYDDFIDRFVTALTGRFPGVLVQWEDFSKENAQPILERYGGRICCFNDDIQGTAGVTLAGILSALKGIDRDIREQRIVILGGGSAGIGIAHIVKRMMCEEGLSEEEAKSRIYIVGRNGLAHDGMDDLDVLKKRFATRAEVIGQWNVADGNNRVSFLETVRHVKPTILLGTSTQSGAFTREVVSAMYAHAARPLIFPLSNPTAQSEATPEDLLLWTKGQALVATGSPFAPVTHEGIVHTIGQCNNLFIFPGIGLGVVATKATRVTDGMFLRAAETLSTFAPVLHNSYHSLFPSVKLLPAISRAIAVTVGEVAVREGLSSLPPEEIEKKVCRRYWRPVYPAIGRRRSASGIDTPVAGSGSAGRFRNRKTDY
ncbi:MAG: NAD-dependent malic enzyme [Simkaniaceae bacterium]|nr:NAD-dependent malic enzyme [Simkaniaceae bacterium]